MNQFRKTALVVVLLCLAKGILAQRPVLVTQDCSLDYNKAQQTVEVFLTWDHLLDYRIQSGTQNIPISQIRLVEASSICTQLNSIINNNPKYSEIDSTVPADRTKYFYRTNNFYFIFWDRKPEPEPEPGKVRIRTGPRRIFIVVSEDFQSVWEFYI